MEIKQRVDKLVSALAQRILVLDGAMGTAIQGFNLGPADFGGEQYEGCNEYLILTRPDVIEKIHASYLAAGADILETNTFGGTPLVLAEYGLQDKTYEINFQAAGLAHKVVEKFSTKDWPRFVAGSMGPTTKAISVTGGVTFSQLIDHFYHQAKALYEGGVDYFLIETCQDTRNIKACLLGIDRVFADKGEKIPVAVSITIEPTGTMLAGQSAESLAASLAHRELLYVGLNCATGPAFMTDSIRSLAEFTESRVACVPNAGLPDEEGRYLETPDMVAKVIRGFAEKGWLNLVGGCCGTGPAHIKALREVVLGQKPRQPKTNHRHFLSGIDYLEITDEMRPVLVGERTNVIGSRKFKNLISEGKFEEASEIARLQVKNGAQIIDVCMANPDRDEPEDMQHILEQVIKKVKPPLMIDSTDDKVIALALTYCQGKAIINSINLEDGEERYQKVLPLAKQMGAALVVGTIDEDKVQGMGVTRERKLSIAQRSYQLLTEKYGVRPEDIYWDCLVFPVGTGDAQYRTSAIETVEGIRLVKKAFPRTRTILGISNVSFGLPPSGREVLNSVFLYHCVQAGLDLAIVNTEQLQRYSSISDTEKKLCEDLLWQRGDDALTVFTEYFRKVQKKEKKLSSNLTLEERLANYILEGTKEGLNQDIDQALQKYKPLEIINGPLMKGMDEVGRLFAKNELIVAEVLQSAEAMKAAVARLEPYMDKADGAQKGTVLLATVKGDVHDIGKNLVDIILSNNGYKVINLGIKVPSEQLIAAVKQHQPTIIGLSGLLVKSAQQMVLTAEDLSKAGINLPVLVGGAALSEKFTHKKIAPAYSGLVAYASDAMKGLELADHIIDKAKFEVLKKTLAEKSKSILQEQEKSAVAPVATPVKKITLLKEIPPAPDFERHILANIPPDEIWRYINPLMLYGRHLGIKGKWVKLLAKGEYRELRESDEGKKAIEIWEIVQQIKQDYKKKVIRPKAVYQFFKAASSGNQLMIYSGDGKTKLATFDFPRQKSGEGLCLADYVTPYHSEPSGAKNLPFDSVSLFAVTAASGDAVRQEAEKLKAAGEYLKSHALQALCLETAEGYAEWLHGKIRGFWGFPDGPDVTMMDRFQAKYRGKRYSFGYPACPNLEDQKILFELLRPEDIGIQLTDGFMMDPEASVSAIVFHHPEATYFNI